VLNYFQGGSFYNQILGRGVCNLIHSPSSVNKSVRERFLRCGNSEMESYFEISSGAVGELQLLLDDFLAPDILHRE
jgi:hypothetical protein